MDSKQKFLNEYKEEQEKWINFTNEHLEQVGMIRIRMKISRNLDEYLPGWHYGFLDGLGFICHIDKEHVYTEATLEEFKEYGYQIQFKELDIDIDLISERMYSKPTYTHKYNCEDFVFYIATGKARSFQREYLMNISGLDDRAYDTILNSFEISSVSRERIQRKYQ